MVVLNRPTAHAETNTSFKLPAESETYAVTQDSPLFTKSQQQPGQIGVAEPAGLNVDVLDLTVKLVAVLALAYVMNFSGQTVTLGLWMAGAGGAFAFLSPVLGWLGVAVTGSDTSSNSLFGLLQVTAAKQAGLSPTLLAASNSSGGVLGKMISPQNLAIGAAAVGLAGEEGNLLRKVLVWSVVLLLVMCVLAFLQSKFLSGMVP
jgi:lactate permease